jgi:hypothetical protein
MVLGILSYTQLKKPNKEERHWIIVVERAARGRQPPMSKSADNNFRVIDFKGVSRLAPFGEPRTFSKFVL